MATELTPVASDGAEVSFGLSTPLSLSGVAAGTPVAGPMPPAMAHAAAQQIAVALADPARDPNAPLELALDPPELGRVRLQITELAGIMTLTIHAERPETAELMRRHIELLSQEFAQAGLDAPSVRISQDGAGGEGARPGEREAASTAPSSPPEAEPLSQPRSRASNGGLDLRL
jgi:flagellar hook-length control protein FliK